jgi:hypothetical protein
MLMNDIRCRVTGVHLVIPGLHRVVAIHGLLGLAQGRDVGKETLPVLLPVLLLFRGHRRERESLQTSPLESDCTVVGS